MTTPPYTMPANWASLRVALSHDWLTGMRGGERVLELLCEGFPDATLHALLYKQGSVSDTIARHTIRTSFLQSIPGIHLRYRYFLPLFPLAIAGLRAPPADLLISTSHCVAKALRVEPGTKHLCYCFTPMRYAWTFYGEYFGNNPLKKALLKPTLAALRSWDRSVSDRVDRFIGISRHVADRIHRCYGREADVVYPPVNTHFYTPGPAGDDGFDLMVSALVPYKRLDLAVEAYSQLGYPLKVVGTGTDRAALEAIAGPNVEFLGWQSDEQVRDLYRRCRFLVFPGEEDFGIVPVEAQACGKPVIAFERGATLESLVPGRTAIFFKDQTPASLLAAVETAKATRWDTNAIRANAERFSVQAFLDGLDQSIQRCLGSKG